MKESFDIYNILRKILSYFNLEPELDDYEKIHQSIAKDIVFKGTNLWILVFAIIVASVGLNMNSTAVIIGAMLISPLMGPINGMGYSIATYDFQLLRQSVKNFSFAVVSSLVASTAYFAISPIATAHSELLARTSPTIYDVLIALFGGLAGIVAISSRQKGNVIPGVAIATALMPPLCTAGYGLATGQLTFFFGAIYLFTINTVFIALSSVVISQILKFPIRSILDEGQKRRVNRWISTIIMLVVLPSIYFGYGLVKKEKFGEKAHRFIANVSIYEGNYLLDKRIDADRKTIDLVYGGAPMTESQKQAIVDKTADFDLGNVSVNIKQGLTFDNHSGTKETEVLRLKEELFTLGQTLKQKNHDIDSLRNRSKFGKQLVDELVSLFPEVVSCSFSDTYTFEAGSDEGSPTLLIVITTNKKGLNVSARASLENWLRARTGFDEVSVIYRQSEPDKHD